MTENLPPQNQNKTELSGFVRTISEPLSKHGVPRWLVYTLGVIGVIYLLNPTAGIFELIPDVLPFVGNIDESIAVMLVLAGIVEVVEGKKQSQSYRQTQTDNVSSQQPPKGKT